MMEYTMGLGGGQKCGECWYKVDGW